MPEPFHDPEKIERLRGAMYSRSLSQKLKDRPRRPLDEEQEPVSEDWKIPEPEFSGSVIAPRNIDSGRSIMRWLLIASITFFIGAAGFFAYYFFAGGGASPAAPGNIGISISGPLHIAGGDLTELQVTVSNQNRAALQLADLVVTFPSGTRSPADLATSLPSQRIPLETIQAGAVRQVPVRAVFAGAERGHVTVKFELEYRLAGSSAIFVASSDYEIIFSSSPLSVTLDGNAETVSGQAVTLAATVVSNAPAPVRDVLLSMGFPFGFTFSSADPRSASPGLWALGDLSPGRAVKVVIRGTLTGESGDERVFRATIGTRKTPDRPSIDTPLADNTLRMTVSRPFLGLSVSVNKGNDTNVVVAPGSSVNVSIAWQNNLQTAITDAVIVARLSGTTIDGQTVRTNDGFYRSSDSAVLWDKTTTKGALASMAPGDHGEVQFSFQVPAGEVLAASQNPRITITVNAAGKRLAESGVPEGLQATAVQTIKLASDLQVNTQGLYYGNPFGTVGPMPPKANSETSYAATFKITNTTSKIRSAKLTATLPSYVRWLGIYAPNSESVSFDANSGIFTWNIGDIVSGTGVSGAPARQMAVEIGFNPSTSQIGSEPVLVQSITLTGTDDATGATVTRTGKDITTNIVGDKNFSSTDASVVR